MKLELPPQLEQTRRMLEGSLRLRPSETVPAVPAGLLDDLNRRFISQKIVIEPKRRFARSGRLRNLISSPAFGLAAAAVMVFGIVTPFVIRGSDSDAVDSVRGISGDVSAPAMIVLVNSPADLENTLAHSGQFESGSLISVRDLAAATDIPEPKVVLDFETAMIRSINADGETVHTGMLPERIADLTLSVAEALSHL